MTTKSHLCHPIASLCLLATLTLQSCYEEKVVTEYVPTIDFPVSKSKEAKPSSFFKHFHFIQLEANDNCLISEIKKVYDVNDTLVVLNKDTDIFTFRKKDGRFICSLSARGEAPHEYAEATDVTVNEDGQCVIFDRLKRRLLYFTLNGKYVKSENLQHSSPMAFGAETTADNHLLLLNRIAKGAGNPPQFAYTLMGEERGKPTSQFDSFEGLSIGDWMIDFAERPTTKTSKGLTFVKILNDTIFHMDNKSKIEPLFVLNTKYRMPSRDALGKYGEYDFTSLYKAQKLGHFCPGLSAIFETKKHIVVEPWYVEEDGYYWIDKNTKKGTYVAAGNDVNAELDKMIRGASIVNIVGSADNELISFLNGAYITVLKKELAEHPEYKPFDKRLKAFAQKADSEGNPCLIFYEH